MLVGAKMTTADISYYRERAAEKRRLAESAGCEEVAAIHAELARLYEALVEQHDLRPAFRFQQRSR